MQKSQFSLSQSINQTGCIDKLLLKVSASPFLQKLAGTSSLNQQGPPFTIQMTIEPSLIAQTTVILKLKRAF